MKRSDKAAIFMIPASILMVIGVFARGLGLSEMTGLVLFLVAMVFLLLGYRQIIKARESGRIPTSTENQISRRFWLLVGTDGLACMVMPFLLPYTGLNLSMIQRVIISVVTFFICIGASWLGIRKGLRMTKNH